MSRLLLLAAVAAASPTVPVLGQPISNSLETPSLLQHIHGTLLTAGGGKFVAIDLPSLRTTTLRPTLDPEKGLDDICGPDAEGQIAYVSGRGQAGLLGALARLYVVRLLHPDGTAEELFTGPGDPLWDEAISPLALSPHGIRIAFVSQPPEKRTKHFQELVTGPLQYWDSRSRTVRDLAPVAFNERPSWFPDGHRLAYAAPVVGPHAEEVPLPRVHIIDTDNGADSILTKGSLPFVSSDGRTVLVERRNGRFVLVNVASRSERVLGRLAGVIRPVALIASHYLLYSGLPTPGAPTGKTENNSPLVGPKPMQALKLLDFDTNEFVTLVPLFDPRDKATVFISFAD